MAYVNRDEGTGVRVFGRLALDERSGKAAKQTSLVYQSEMVSKLEEDSGLFGATR